MPLTIRTIVFWGAVSCLFAGMLFWGIEFGIYEPPQISAGLSPRTYPRMVVLLLFCTALYLLAASVLHHRRVQARVEEFDETDTGVPYAGGKLLLICAIVAGYCAAIPYLGLAPTSTLAFVLLTRLSGERRMGRMLCIGAALGAGLYYFFLYAAAVPMPPGPFGGVI